MRTAIDTLARGDDIPDEELARLIGAHDADSRQQLADAADAVRHRWYGTDVYIRGLIELTNYCKNNCYYCGIRAGNTKAIRYRLQPDAVLSCCAAGWELGFRTFVLQGGEDAWWTDERLCALVRAIKDRWPQCAVTLSLGERPPQSYAALRAAGADRYLLRHETATPEHYRQLHPPGMEAAPRQECLRTLKAQGWQTGSGFMVGSPGQTVSHLVADMRFLQSLGPAMIGIGPYLTHPDTPFANQPNGSLERTLRCISLLRLLFPKALLPATTALGTIAPGGREMGLRAGANVVMPNLSPSGVRAKYSLYANKLATGLESAEGLDALRRSVADAGYQIVTARGDALC